MGSVTNGLWEACFGPTSNPKNEQEQTSSSKDTTNVKKKDEGGNLPNWLRPSNDANNNVRSKQTIQVSLTDLTTTSSTSSDDNNDNNDDAIASQAIERLRELQKRSGDSKRLGHWLWRNDRTTKTATTARGAPVSREPTPIQPPKSMVKSARAQTSPVIDNQAANDTGALDHLVDMFTGAFTCDPATFPTLELPECGGTMDDYLCNGTFNQEWTVDGPPPPPPLPDAPLDNRNQPKPVKHTRPRKWRWMIALCLTLPVLAVLCWYFAAMATNSSGVFSFQESASEEISLDGANNSTETNNSTQTNNSTAETVADSSDVVEVSTPFPTSSPTKFRTKRVDFAAIGDVPYDSSQARILRRQIDTLEDGYDFLVHVGDLRSAADGNECTRQEYEDVADILRRSTVPVFIIPGDNDWVDCPNMEEGLLFWDEIFLEFVDQWDHSFDIIRQPKRPHNFAFVHDRVLFFGLNIPGGSPENELGNAWEIRLMEQWAWLRAVIDDYIDTMGSYTGRIVIFGHANPTGNHRTLFRRLSAYIEDELENSTPILYLNGDEHEWSYDSWYYDQESFLRIMLMGEAKEGPTWIRVVSNGEWMDTEDAFTYERYDR